MTTNRSLSGPGHSLRRTRETLTSRGLRPTDRSRRDCDVTAFKNSGRHVLPICLLPCSLQIPLNCFKQELIRPVRGTFIQSVVVSNVFSYTTKSVYTLEVQEFQDFRVWLSAHPRQYLDPSILEPFSIVEQTHGRRS